MRMGLAGKHPHCLVPVDQWLDSQVGDRKSQDILKRDVAGWNVRFVNPVIANSGGRSEMEMRRSDVALLIWMPVECNDFSPVGIVQRIEVPGDNRPPRVVFVIAFNNAVVLRGHDLQSTIATQPYWLIVSQGERVWCQRDMIASAHNRHGSGNACYRLTLVFLKGVGCLRGRSAGHATARME